MTGLEGEAEDTWVGLDLGPPEEEEAERRPHLSLQLPEKRKQRVVRLCSWAQIPWWEWHKAIDREPEWILRIISLL